MGEIASVEIRFMEICFVKYCPFEVSHCDVSLSEVSASELKPDEISLNKGGPNFRILSAPPVPNGDSLLEDLEVFFVGHRVFFSQRAERGGLWSKSVMMPEKGRKGDRQR